MTKWYGSVSNRLEEGKNYTGRELREGDDITMYLWSDCHCYYITKVINQKEIQVRPYYVCADHSKIGGMGHQNWLYFKTQKEENEYLSKYFPDRDFNENPKEPEPETWVYKNGNWKEQTIYTLESIKAYCDKKHFGVNDFLENFTPTQQEKLRNGKQVKKYQHLIGKVSFGVRNYYYDWSF